MVQLISVVASFLLIPLLSRMKLKLSYTVLISAGVLALLSRLRVETLTKIALNIFVDPSSRETVLTIMMVSILSGLMKHFKILDRVVEAIMLLIRNKRNALVLIPAMIGILIIPGGALMSAPFIDDLGKDMGISPPRRVAINLVFRHLAMFLLPYSTSLLIIFATMPHLNMYRLILLNLAFIFAILLFGYLFFLKDIKAELSGPREDIGKNLFLLILYTSPIYMAVIINSLTGWPFYITLIFSVSIVYLLSTRKDFFKTLIQSINWDTIVTVIGVLIIKDIILNMGDLIGIFNNLLVQKGSMLYTMGMLMVTAIIFGYITGNNTAALAIVLPIFSQISIKGGLIYIYTYFIFGATFIGYYFSPIHLCQAFTLSHMGVTARELHYEYRYYGPSLLLYLIATTFVFQMVFKIWVGY